MALAMPLVVCVCVGGADAERAAGRALMEGGQGKPGTTAEPYGATVAR